MTSHKKIHNYLAAVTFTLGALLVGFSFLSINESLSREWQSAQVFTGEVGFGDSVPPVSTGNLGPNDNLPMSMGEPVSTTQNQNTTANNQTGTDATEEAGSETEEEQEPTVCDNPPEQNQEAYNVCCANREGPLVSRDEATQGVGIQSDRYNELRDSLDRDCQTIITGRDAQTGTNLSEFERSEIENDVLQQQQEIENILSMVGGGVPLEPNFTSPDNAGSNTGDLSGQGGNFSEPRLPSFPQNGMNNQSPNFQSPGGGTGGGNTAGGESPSQREQETGTNQTDGFFSNIFESIRGLFDRFLNLFRSDSSDSQDTANDPQIPNEEQVTDPDRPMLVLGLRFNNQQIESPVNPIAFLRDTEVQLVWASLNVNECQTITTDEDMPLIVEIEGVEGVSELLDFSDIAESDIIPIQVECINSQNNRSVIEQVEIIVFDNEEDVETTNQIFSNQNDSASSGAQTVSEEGVYDDGFLFDDFEEAIDFIGNFFNDSTVQEMSGDLSAGGGGQQMSGGGSAQQAQDPFNSSSNPSGDTLPDSAFDNLDDSTRESHSDVEFTGNCEATVQFRLGPRRPNRPNQDVTEGLRCLAATVLGSGSTYVMTSGMGQYGSLRHRQGHAADGYFVDPAGVTITLSDPRMRQLALTAPSFGFTGFGAGPEYMGNRTVHIDNFPLARYSGGMAQTWGSYGRLLRREFENRTPSR